MKESKNNSRKHLHNNWVIASNAQISQPQSLELLLTGMVLMMLFKYPAGLPRWGESWPGQEHIQGMSVSRGGCQESLQGEWNEMRRGFFS